MMPKFNWGALGMKVLLSFGLHRLRGDLVVVYSILHEGFDVDSNPTRLKRSQGLSCRIRIHSPVCVLVVKY